MQPHFIPLNNKSTLQTQGANTYLVQDFLDLLMVPSLHINLPSDVHLAIPPFLPEQGLLPFAITSVAIQKDKIINATVTTLRIALPF